MKGTINTLCFEDLHIVYISGGKTKSSKWYNEYLKHITSILKYKQHWIFEEVAFKIFILVECKTNQSRFLLTLLIPRNQVYNSGKLIGKCT